MNGGLISRLSDERYILNEINDFNCLWILTNKSYGLFVSIIWRIGLHRQGGICAHDQWGDNYSNLQWGEINIPAGMGRTNAVGRMTKISGGKVEINDG